MSVRHLCAALGLLIVAGCAPALDEVDASCQQTADCAPGRVCDERDFSCIPEPENGLLGRFRCLVHDANVIEPGSPGSTDILGVVAGERVAVNGVADCQVSESADQFSLGALTAVTVGGVDYLLQVTLPWIGLGQGTYDLEAPDVVVQRSTAFVSRNVAGAFERFLGFSVHGSIRLDGEPRLEEQVSGYVEISFQPAVQGIRVGKPCPNGIADCTDQPQVLAGFACSPKDRRPAEHRICTGLCTSDADCAPFGARCAMADPTEGVCFQPCMGDADCGSPLTLLPETSLGEGLLARGT